MTVVASDQCGNHAAGLGKRIHAWCLANWGRNYERMVVERKQDLLGSLSGTVLEIGPGTGPNLRFLPAGCRWIGVEPNPYMLPYLRRSAAQAGLAIELREGAAERLPAPAGSMDAVVGTLVLCSVRDPERALLEILRVLKPGGRFVFVEHVAAQPGTRLCKIQRCLRPLWKCIADGCHPDRDTGSLIRQAGFSTVQFEDFRLPLGPVAPQIAGYAER